MYLHYFETNEYLRISVEFSSIKGEFGPKCNVNSTNLSINKTRIEPVIDRTERGLSTMVLAFASN